MKKKILSLILTIAMVLCLFPAAVFAADEAVHNCDSSEGVYCIVCDVAEKINALPERGNITVDNAATVTEQIHAIDRIKGELTAEQYYEMMTLVDGGNDGSGYGEDVPVRYMEAVAAVCALDEPSLYIIKTFLSEDGRAVIVDDAEVQFQVTNIETNVSQTLTMSDMKAAPGSLSAAADFYSENADENGWSYKYILPAGTYRVEEVSYSGTTENDADIVTTKVTYNGIESTDGTLVTLAAGAEDNVNVNVSNYVTPTYDVDAKDAEGNSVYGVSMSIQGVTEPDFYHTWETDGELTRFYLMTDREYTLTVHSVPDGYEMPSPASVTFTAEGDTSVFTDSFALTGSNRSYTVNVTTPAVEVGSGYVTVNFVGRDGNPIAVDGAYSHGTEDSDGDGVIDMTQTGEFTEVSSYKMENLADGLYGISVYNIHKAGYASGGVIEFKLEGGKIVEEYDETTEEYTPYSNSHTIRSWDEHSITIEVESITYDFSVSVMGIDAALPYEVKDAEGNLAAWSYNEDVENPDSGSVHLEPGNYTFHALKDELFEGEVIFPAENEYLEFTVNEDYTVTIVSSEYNTEIDDYGSSYWLIWYLEPTDTVTVTATISTSDGTNFPDNTTISLYMETSYDEETGESYYSEVHSVAVPTDVNTYTYTWTVATYHSETDEYGDEKLVENSYVVNGMDSEWNEIYFNPEENNVWTATIVGRGLEAEFETMADAGYYSETSDSDNQVGVIVLNVHIVNIDDIQGNIVNYGMWIYKNGVPVELSMPENASDNVSQLIADGGYYHAIVKNIPQEDFGTVFYGIPFIVVDTDGNPETGGDWSILTCDAVDASVYNYYNWLGAVNPY